MKSFWNKSQAKKIKDDLGLRVYTSRLLGQESSLVLHGGGNTSVKTKVKNIFGETENILYIKGSGWDLATIEAPGFAPVKMDALVKMARLKNLTDDNMVKLQRAAMINPNAPNPSVEAILHAIIPYKFVDHTHADAVVTITNTPDGEKRIKEVYGNSVIYVPYVMPGFILAQKIYEMTKNITWSKYKGMVLLNHGIFTFDDDAKTSYENMIRLVSKAENYLKRKVKLSKSLSKSKQPDLLKIAQIRREISKTRGKAMLAVLDQSTAQIEFSNLSNVKSISTRGPLTPDHVIRTKPKALIIGNDISKSMESFTIDYLKYYNRNKTQSTQCLDKASRWAVWPGFGTFSFGCTLNDAAIISDIKEHTTQAIRNAEGLGGWKALPDKDIFDVEYWSLEQAKLNKKSDDPVFQGKVALVTGAASGIGRACVESLNKKGAVVLALDINSDIEKIFKSSSILGLKVDVTKEDQIKRAVETAVLKFGGLDIIVSNAGNFPPSEQISDLKEATWQKSMDLNLNSHQVLMKHTIPFLKLGIDPTIIIIASKNVPAPGPGVSAYSVAKAGLTQLGRVAALELAKFGIRVNMIHPNAVFDTGIWTKDILEKRAKSYGVSIEEYKKTNLLKVEITSKDVAELAAALAGPTFSKTTGAQIPIDGGNDRVI